MKRRIILALLAIIEIPTIIFLPYWTTVWADRIDGEIELEGYFVDWLCGFGLLAMVGLFIALIAIIIGATRAFAEWLTSKSN